jgi:hypothetical protein
MYIMDVGGSIGLLIDIACQKAGTQVIELNQQLADRIVEMLF